MFQSQITHVQRPVVRINLSPRGREMRIIRGGRITHRPITPSKQMAEIVSQLLNVVIGHVLVVPQSSVLCGLSDTLDARVRDQVEVLGSGMRDNFVHASACGHVAVPVLGISRVAREKTRVVALLDHQERYGGLVALLEFFAGVADGLNFFVHYFEKLALGDPVSEEDYVFGLHACKKVCLNQK